MYLIGEDLMQRIVDALDAATENAYELRCEHVKTHGDQRRRMRLLYESDERAARGLLHDLHARFPGLARSIPCRQQMEPRAAE